MSEEKLIGAGWIQFFQNPYDRVVYTTNDLFPEKASLTYKKFLVFVDRNYRIKERDKFFHELDSFQTIFLNGDSGEWKVVVPTKKDSTFEDLHKLN